MININRQEGMKKYLPGLAIIAVLISTFFGGFYAGQGNKADAARLIAYYDEKANTDTSEDLDFNLYWEVWNRLKSEHVDKNSLKNRDLFYGSLKGMAEATGDPYTVFMDPEEAQGFRDDLAGTFEGIGAEIGMRDDIITIVAPLDGMPAQKAGLKAGDKIYAINNESSLGLSVDEAVRKIRGEKGTKVTLTIIRGEKGKAFDISIVRDVITVKSVKTEMRSDGLYVIKVTNFNDDTLGLFNAAINDILTKKPKGIILDLRNNPGGYLDTAVALASEWVEAGPIVAEQFGENRRNEYPANGYARLKDYPTVVLINGGSASASEILAGALRDYKKATLVGEQTFGKGSVQTLEELSDGSSLKVTVAKWLTPAGDFINEKGLEPQVKVEITEAEAEKEIDSQFNKAIEILKTKK